MPNIQSLTSDIGELSQLYPRYAVSRVIADKADDLLCAQVPVHIENISDLTVELHLYSLADNSLIFSDFLRSSGSSDIYVETLQYEDDTQRSLLYIDFAKFDQMQTVPDGTYSVTLNFFADEVGAYDNKNLKVNVISTSRTEVELNLTDMEQLETLAEFTIPRIPATHIHDVLKQIFNQEGADDVHPPTSPAKIDVETVYGEMEDNYGAKLHTYNFDEDIGSEGNPSYRIGINTIIQNILNTAYTKVLEKINEDIENGATAFTQDVLTTYMEEEFQTAYAAVQSEAEGNPLKYRFNLI